MVPVEVMLGSIDHAEVQACSISRIPDEIRTKKEECFRPSLVSVGPLHRGATRQILLMEEPKWRYAKSFLDRRLRVPQGNNHGGHSRGKSPEPTGIRVWGNEILKLDKVVRASYGGDLDLDPHDLAKIMMVDGCFLLELLHRLKDYMNQPQAKQPQTISDDPFLETEEKVKRVLNDISMLENQIPSIVLKRLYTIVFPDNTISFADDHRVATVIRDAFGYNSKNNHGLAHMLHLMHMSTVEEEINNQDTKRLRQARRELKRCARRLQAAGITIRSRKSNNTAANGNANANTTISNQHKLVDIFDFDISFNKEDKVLEIPALHIKETTELRWRNMIAWEQSRIWIRGRYTSYALFFQTLICSEHDIKLLEKKGVIVNEIKMSRAELKTMFETISAGVEHMDSSYGDHCKKLNEHRTTLRTKVFRQWPIITWHIFRRFLETVVFYFWNWYAILIRDHLSTVWKTVAVVAATLALVLTIMQTYYSAKQVQLAEQPSNSPGGH
ncbi:hypothetical protein PIB30_007630 [Stylosanthes scabra]|nr:hypothetical protein [Stylosanthes scabra]